jgi:hypothetical protein
MSELLQFIIVAAFGALCFRCGYGSCGCALLRLG